MLHDTFRGRKNEDHFLAIILITIHNVKNVLFVEARSVVGRAAGGGSGFGVVLSGQTRLQWKGGVLNDS